MKRIKNKKVYHTQSFHKKYFKIVFKSGNLTIYNTKEDVNADRTIPIASLQQVICITDSKNKNKLETETGKRNKQY
jgi:hypothetical protein